MTSRGPYEPGPCAVGVCAVGMMLEFLYGWLVGGSTTTATATATATTTATTATTATTVGVIGCWYVVVTADVGVVLVVGLVLGWCWVVVGLLLGCC